jgi:TRAP-type C4-dicarboxylate transport system permease large subunit
MGRRTLILMASAGFAWILTGEGIAESVAVMFTEFTANPYLFLLLVNLLLLVAGMFLDGNAAIIVLTPLLMPTVRALGMDEYLKEILPFYVALLATLAATTYVPWLSLVFASLIK